MKKNSCVERTVSKNNEKIVYGRKNRVTLQCFATTKRFVALLYQQHQKQPVVKRMQPTTQIDKSAESATTTQYFIGFSNNYFKWKLITLHSVK